MKRSYRLFLPTLLFLLLAPPCFGAGLADKVREYTLKNGMKLLLVERHTSPTVSAWIRFKVGSVDERSDERGLAHLLEHMLFKGTKTLGTTDYAAEKPVLDEIEATAQLMMAEQAKREKGDEKRITELKKELNRLQERRGLKDRAWAVEYEASALEFLLETEFKLVGSHRVIRLIAEAVVELQRQFYPDCDRLEPGTILWATTKAGDQAKVSWGKRAES